MPNRSQDSESDWKEDLSGYMDEHFGKKTPVQHLYPGGIAGDVNEDDEDSATTSDTPSSPSDAAMSPDPGPVFNPKAGLPPAPPPPAATVLPPTNSDPMQAYLAQQKQMLQKYGPDQQMAVEQAIQKQRTGLVPNLANAGAGLADAIMQGVARAGPSNFQSNLQNRQDRTQEGMRQAVDRSQASHLAQMKQQMELAQIDPESPISKSVQRANMPTLQKLGYSPEDVAAIPASMMPEATARRLTLEEINSKAALAEATLKQTAAYQGQSLINTAKTIKQTGEHQSAEDAKAAREQKLKEDTEASKHWISHPINAFKAGQRISGGSTDASQYTPDVVNYATRHNITPEQAQAIKDKRTGAN